uniref:DNA primase large subunit C-terminal domain-containing protein n=1 Tax=Percolomonas cosmopolitus TaxID=63605 RepID=A0A7S1PGK7_9EUKA
MPATQGQALGTRRNRSNRSKRAHVTIDAATHDLSQWDERSWQCFYKGTPRGDVTLDEFEYCSYKRLVLLRQIDQCNARGFKGNITDGHIQKSSTEIYGPHSEFKYKEDSTSHHILRLAHCKTDALRRWFVQQESTLFHHRLRTHNVASKELLKHAGVEVTECTAEEMEERKNVLLMYKVRNQPLPTIYKVRFEMVLKLVQSRDVYLERGMAFVTQNHLTTIIMQRFKTHLMEQLELLAKVWAKVEQTENDRLVPFLNRVANKSILLTNKQASSSFTDTGDEVLPDHLDMLRNESYPLCMRVLHNKLRQTHHLKHFGRMQYGLFLKGIGLSLQNALVFWSSELTQNISHQKFEQGYAYNIRHNYGKEGKGQNYSPYGCHKIITTNAEDCVCPFKHYDRAHLTKLLKSEASHLEDYQIEEMHELNAGKHYQVSCRNFFEATHPKESEWPKSLRDDDDGAPFMHPNRYYKASRQILRHTKKADIEEKDFATKEDTMDTTEE